MARALRARRPPALSPGAARALRYGRRSALQAAAALVALVALSAVGTLLPGGVTSRSAVAGAYLLVPLLNVAGIGFGAAGLALSPRKLSPAVGLTLNLAIVVVAGRMAMQAIENS